MTLESLHRQQQKLRFKWLRHDREQKAWYQNRKFLMDWLLLTLLIFFISVQFV